MKDTSINYSGIYVTNVCRIVSSDVYNLPVVVDTKLEPGYLEEAAKANFHYLDGGKPQFRLRLKVCSTIHSEDPKLGAFLYAANRESPVPEKELLNVKNTCFHSFLY